MNIILEHSVSPVSHSRGEYVPRVGTSFVVVTPMLLLLFPAFAGGSTSAGSKCFSCVLQEFTDFLSKPVVGKAY